MEIFTTDNFNKKYTKLNNNLKLKIDIALDKFIINPFDISLLNHNLQGKLNGFKSIKAGFDLRILFKEENGYTLVIMIDLDKQDDIY